MEAPSLERGVRDAAGRPGLLLRTPYDERFVEQLKDVLPAGTRRWDPERKAWWILEAEAKHAQQLVLMRWPAIHLLGAGDGGEDLLLGRDGVAAVQGRLL